MTFCLLFVHWVADFLLQSTNMGNRKSTSPAWLSLHVLVYTTALALGTVYFGHQELPGFFNFIAVNGGLYDSST